MMMADDRRDFRVVIDLGKDALAYSRVLFHLAALVERQRAWFFKETSRKANLADIMYKPCQMRKML